jgi:sugar lactone lactonase YvrE
MKKIYVILIVLIFALTVAYIGIQAKGNGQLEAVKSFNAEGGELPEGITIDKAGNIYVSLGPPFFVGGGYGAVWKLSPDGTETTELVEYPTGPAPAGLAVDASGNVVFVLGDPGGTVGGVYRVTSDGGTERLPGTEGVVVPNGIAFDKQNNLFVSDSVLGAIWRVPADGSTPAEIWFQHELIAGCTPEDFGANGIAFWKGDLYVANTGRGALVHVPILTDGSPGEPTLVAGNLDCEPEGLFGMDGIALDVHGNVYALLVLQNKLVRIDPSDGSFTTLLTEEDGLWNPASIAFGTGKGDRESIFITNYAVIPPGSEIFGPAVLKYDVGVPGLPLP